MPKEVEEKKREEHGGGGGGEKVAEHEEGHGGPGGGREEDMVMRPKDADQMTGQTFNDVGPLGGEGTGRVDRPGRM